jgi:hypothetical protein
MEPLFSLASTTTAAGRQHDLAGHDRLEALVHELDSDSFLHVQAWLDRSLAAGGAARASSNGGLERVCLRLN